MKIVLEVEIDCTPEEAKALWNMPDITPVNRAVTEALETQVRRQIMMPLDLWSRMWGLPAPR